MRPSEYVCQQTTRAALRRPFGPAAKGVVFACLLFLTGCSTYQLQGTVVQGRSPGIFVVDKDDRRLFGKAVLDSQVFATLDPDKIRPKPLQPAVADDDGRFALPISETGAGLLEYSVSLVCRAPGFQYSSATIPVPSGDKRVLIVMTPGKDTYKPKEDIAGEVEKFEKQFE